jgi:hypothetical protein
MVFRFIFTSSINTPEREELYLKCITKSLDIIKGMPFEVYLVENNGLRQTLFDDISGVTLYYTDTNRAKSFGNIGVREFTDIILLAERYNFHEDDIIIKLTGLYTIEEPNKFLEFVMNHADRYDAFMKWVDVTSNNYFTPDCVLGLYAIRYKYIENFNYLEMMNHPSMEHIFAKHVREAVPEDRIAEIGHLGLFIEKWKMLV